MDANEFSRLERFVDNLLAKYNELKERNKLLKSNLAEQVGRCQGMEQELDELKGERSEVGNRVSGLIRRIERWESEEDEGEDRHEERAENVQGNLFSNRTNTA